MRNKGKQQSGIEQVELEVYLSKISNITYYYISIFCRWITSLSDRVTGSRLDQLTHCAREEICLELNRG